MFILIEVNLDRVGNTTMFFIIEKTKETILDFSQGTVGVLGMCSTNLFCVNIILLQIDSI